MALYSRNSIIVLLIISIFLGITFSPISLLFQEARADEISTSVTISVTGCGNDIREGSEQCDGTDLDEQTCGGLGYTGGTLSCNPDCTFNTSGCTSGGGGGGGGEVPRIATKVVLQGKAYPKTKVTILKDGQVAEVITADSQANFEAEITDITAGIWTFGVWGEDKRGRRSITFSFTANIISGVITTISGIFLPPTIELEKTNLAKGEALNILGQTAPESEVNVSVESPAIMKETKADEEGDWLYLFDTAILDEGYHTTRAKATSPEGLLSSFSTVLAFYVGKGAPEVICPNADLNGDARVNLIDFSILLFWWGKINSCADQNHDGIVNLPDFSIMLYYWTG